MGYMTARIQTRASYHCTVLPAIKSLSWLLAQRTHAHWVWSLENMHGRLAQLASILLVSIDGLLVLAVPRSDKEITRIYLVHPQSAQTNDWFVLKVAFCPRFKFVLAFKNQKVTWKGTDDSRKVYYYVWLIASPDVISLVFLLIPMTVIDQKQWSEIYGRTWKQIDYMIMHINMYIW